MRRGGLSQQVCHYHFQLVLLRLIINENHGPVDCIRLFGFIQYAALYTVFSGAQDTLG
jgi:hypothetical protein